MTSLRKLIRIESHLNRLLTGFEWTPMTKDEVEEEGSLDPPSALLRGRMGPFRIDLHVDGESIVGFQSGKYMNDDWVPGCIDMTMKPVDIAKALIAAVDALNQVKDFERN